MACTTTAAEHFAVWSDLASLVLLGMTLLTAGITPTYSVMHQSWKKAVAMVLMMLLTAFSFLRFLIEGIFIAPGPREFLAASVIYLSRWLWLFISFQRSRTASHGFEVTRALLELHTIRVAKDFRRPWRSQGDDSETCDEIVITRGHLRDGERIKRHSPYWTGFEQSITRYSHPNIVVVDLVEKNLHSKSLEKLGVVAYEEGKKDFNFDLEGVYRAVYELVMTVQRPQGVIVDYEPFLARFAPVPAGTRFAQRQDCVDSSTLGGIARRVATDACYFIANDHADPRTFTQVHCINECIERAVDEFIIAKGSKHVRGPREIKYDKRTDTKP